MKTSHKQLEAFLAPKVKKLNLVFLMPNLDKFLLKIQKLSIFQKTPKSKMLSKSENLSKFNANIIRPSFLIFVTKKTFITYN